MASTALPPRDDYIEAEVDMAFGGDFLEDVQDVMGKNPGLTIRLIKPVGPAGGAPVVRLHGNRGVVATALCNDWHLSYDEIEELVGATIVRHEEPAPIASDEWLQRFKPDDNVWNLYTQFKVERKTTDKLEGYLNDLSDGHSFLIGGEPEDVVTPAEDGWEVLQVTYVGGRDWVIILGNVGP
jgi:hypothetical protein